MPAKSKAQRRVAAIAKNHPEQLHARNKGMAKMSKKQLGDFARGSEKRLPMRKRKLKGR